MGDTRYPDATRNGTVLLDRVDEFGGARPTLDREGKPVEMIGGPFSRSADGTKPGSLADTTPNGTRLRDRIEDVFGCGGVRNRRSVNGTALLDRVDEDFGGGGVYTTKAPFGAKVVGPSEVGTAWETANGTAMSSGVPRMDGETTARWTMRRRTDLFEGPYIYAVVEGADEEDAFQHGKAGEALPLWEVAPPLPVLNELRWQESGRVIALHMEREWSEAFFGSYERWERADDAGIVLRVAEMLSREHRARVAQGESVDPRTTTRDQRQKAALIMRSLTDPDEVLDADQGDGIGHVDLGDDPEFTKVCVRAVAIQFLGEGPDVDTMAMLELPKAQGSDLRRFLFFGTRS